MKAIFIFCLALFCLSFTGITNQTDTPTDQDRVETIETVAAPSPLAWRYVQQLASAGCITWTGQPTSSLTVTVIDCECFEDYYSSASFKLRVIASQPDITVISGC